MLIQKVIKLTFFFAFQEETGCQRDIPGCVRSIFPKGDSQQSGLTLCFSLDMLPIDLRRPSASSLLVEASSTQEMTIQHHKKLILVLMKLCLTRTNSFLATLFGINGTTCSHIVNTWIPFLARELKSLVFWPDRISITNMLPKDLGAKYPLLQCTLDCTEVLIQRPRQVQAQTWCDYKKHNTAKYLVAIAPNGMISFLSKGSGGRTPDKHIVRESGFLDLVDPGDVILADRGFTVQVELLQRHAKLEIPPHSSGWEQQMADAVGKTKKIANACIHVERAIGRMKWFAILRNTVPISLVPIMDDIVLVGENYIGLHLFYPIHYLF
uniref:DDE Tnp4 domain-containing protein n=1 Tax=Salarias fasciatus TaxID=181472 RepID=A0A672FQU9_SALFA